MDEELLFGNFSSLITLLFSFLLFYLIIFIFLKKSRIFDSREKKANSLYYSLASLSISALSIYSLYSLGIIEFFPIFSGIFAILIFFFTYFYGIFKHSMSKLEIIGESYDVLVAKIKQLISEYEKEKSEEKRRAIKDLLEKLEILSKKIGKDIEKEEWYKKAKEIVG